MFHIDWDKVIVKPPFYVIPKKGLNDLELLKYLSPYRMEIVYDIIHSVNGETYYDIGKDIFFTDSYFDKFVYFKPN